MDIKEKVKCIASTMEIGDNQTEFDYFESMMNSYFENDPDLPIIKSKMNNLIKLLEIKSSNREEFQKFVNLDFEEEIWNMI